MRCVDPNPHAYNFAYTNVSSKHSIHYSSEFRLRAHDCYRGGWWNCNVEFCPRRTHNNRHRFGVVEQREQEQWVILTTFNSAGAFAYVCNLHLLMTGTVIVN